MALLVTGIAFALTAPISAHAEGSIVERGADAAQDAEPSGRTVREILEGTRQFTLFNTLIRLANLDAEIHDGGPMTLFVPSDTAVLQELHRYTDGVERDDYAERIRKLVLGHVLREQYLPEDFAANIAGYGGRLNMETRGREALTARMTNGNLSLIDERGRSRPLKAPIVGIDGIVYELDGPMLMPR